MSPRFATSWAWALGFPRVSGDEPLEATFGPKIEGFSPRERG